MSSIQRFLLSLLLLTVAACSEEQVLERGDQVGQYEVVHDPCKEGAVGDPAAIKGNWFATYNDADIAVDAATRLETFIHDDAQFIEGAGGATVDKAGYVAQAVQGAFGDIIDHPEHQRFEVLAAGCTDTGGVLATRESNHFTIEAFGVSDLPADAVSLWRVGKVEGRPTWQLQYHLSSFASSFELRGAIASVVEAANGLIVLGTSVTVKETFVAQGYSYQLVYATVAPASGGRVDVAALLRQDGKGHWTAVAAEGVSI